MRHRTRHVHKTTLEHLRAALQAGGWLSEPVVFSTTPVTLIDYEPQEVGETPAYNTVAVSIGTTGDDEEWELGGGMHRTSYTLFVDIYPTEESIGVALADDLKDALTENVIRLRDYTADSAGAVTDGQIWYEDVLVETIPTGTGTLDKRTWRSVKATATVYQ